MVQILETPDKSPADNKDYRAIKLDNGLVALLISDLHDYEEGDEMEEDGEMEPEDEPMSGDEDEMEEGDEEDETGGKGRFQFFQITKWGRITT